MRITQALLDRVDDALGSPEDIMARIHNNKSGTIHVLSNTIKGPILGTISESDGDYLIDYATNPLLLLHREISGGTVRDFNVDYTTTMVLEKIVINAEYHIPVLHRELPRVLALSSSMIILDDNLRKIINILYPIGDEGDHEYEARVRLNRIGLMCVNRNSVIAVTEEVYNFQDKTITFTWKLVLTDTNEIFGTFNDRQIFDDVNLILNGVENPPDTQRALNSLPSYSTVFAQIRQDRDMMVALFPIIRLPILQAVSEFRLKWESFRTAIRTAAVESGVVERTARMTYGVLSLQNYCPSNFLM